MGSLFADKQIVFGPADFFKVMFAGFCLSIVQCVAAARFGYYGFGPEWTLTLAIFVALRTELWAAAITAFFLGLVRDVTSGILLGLWSLFLVMLVWLFFPYRRRLNFYSPLALTPLIFFLLLGGYLFIMTPMMAILGWPSDKFNPLPAFLSSASLTAVTSPPLFVLLNWLTCKKDQDDG